MLTIFFTIIFIAELIIACWVISVIQKLDRKVCEMNQKVLDFQPVLKERICKFQIAVNTVLLGIDYFAQFITKKKDECLNYLSKNIITAILFLVLNTSGKKVLTFVDLFFSFKKFMQTH